MADHAANGPDEGRRFVDTAHGFARAPASFSADWAAGRREALNPLGFMATALGIAGLAAALAPGSEGGILSQIARAILPYAYYVALGLVAHPLLRLAGGRTGLRATLAISLFAGGGPGLVYTLSIYVVYFLRVRMFPGFEAGLIRNVPPPRSRWRSSCRWRRPAHGSWPRWPADSPAAV
jgi:hypothetical protein